MAKLRPKPGESVQARGFKEYVGGMARSDMTHHGKYIGEAAIVEVTLPDGGKHRLVVDPSTLELEPPKN